MHRTKITIFIALCAVSAFLLILSFTPLAGGASKARASENKEVDADMHPGALALTRADSRKKHGTSGAGPIFDIEMPLSATLISGTSGVEDRQGGDSDGGGAGDYKIVLTFNGHDPITGGTASVTAHNPGGAGGVVDAGNVAFGFNEMIIPLTGVTNAQVLTVTASNVTDGADVISSVDVNVGFLIGNTTGNRTVSNTDVASVKAQASAPITASNFRTDVNANGFVSNTDVSATKAQVSTTLP